MSAWSQDHQDYEDHQGGIGMSLPVFYGMEKSGKSPAAGMDRLIMI